MLLQQLLAFEFGVLSEARSPTRCLKSFGYNCYVWRPYQPFRREAHPSSGGFDWLADQRLRKVGPAFLQTAALYSVTWEYAAGEAGPDLVPVWLAGLKWQVNQMGSRPRGISGPVVGRTRQGL
jgi:hypothetical protein